MRVVLVGRPSSRARLRRKLDEAGVEIVGEYDTLSAARASVVESDGILLAEPSDGTSADDEAWIEEPLTRRELDVLQLLAEGLANKSIAERLGISDQTVKFHVASISSKLGASNRTDAVRLGLRRGLISL
jgi:DNA-binding CsgD family transcriptional regulator